MESKKSPLRTYIYANTSKRGQTLAHTLGYSSPQAMQMALRRGIAIYRTNTLHTWAESLGVDIDELKEANKQTLEREYHITPSSVVTSVMINDPLRAVMQLHIENAEITQKDLAKNIDISPARLSRLLSEGATYKKGFDLLTRVCEQLELTPEETDYVMMANKTTLKQTLRGSAKTAL